MYVKCWLCLDVWLLCLINRSPWLFQPSEALLKGDERLDMTPTHANVSSVKANHILPGPEGCGPPMEAVHAGRCPDAVAVTPPTLHSLHSLIT
jgi:hypothetical protein